MFSSNRFDLQSAREYAFEMITFLKGYYIANTGKDNTQAIETVKECFESWHEAAGSGHLYDAPAYYTIIARLLEYMPVMSSKDSEGWANRLSMLAHTKLYSYLENMVAARLHPVPVLDVSIDNMTHNLRPEDLNGAHQVWYASVLVPGGAQRLFDIERRDTAFTIFEHEGTGNLP